jgi:hypothetical protein
VPQRTPQTAEQAKGTSKLALRPTLIRKAMNTGFLRDTQSSSAVRVAGEPKINTAISVYFLRGFYIEVGNAYLPRPLHGEHQSV